MHELDAEDKSSYSRHPERQWREKSRGRRSLRSSRRPKNVFLFFDEMCTAVRTSGSILSVVQLMLVPQVYVFSLQTVLTTLGRPAHSADWFRAGSSPKA